MNIDSGILSEVINKRQSERVVNALADVKEYFKNYIFKRTLADILDEASRVCNTDFLIDTVLYDISDALEELEMHYILNSPDIRDLVPISCYLDNDNYAMTCVEYHLLGVELVESYMFSPEIKYYLFIVENNVLRRIETTETFITSHLTKDYFYQPKCLGDIIDGLASGYRGDDIG